MRIKVFHVTRHEDGTFCADSEGMRAFCTNWDEVESSVYQMVYEGPHVKRKPKMVRIEFGTKKIIIGKDFRHVLSE